MNFGETLFSTISSQKTSRSFPWEAEESERSFEMCLVLQRASRERNFSEGDGTGFMQTHHWDLQKKPKKKKGGGEIDNNRSWRLLAKEISLDPLTTLDLGMTSFSLASPQSPSFHPFSHHPVGDHDGHCNPHSQPLAGKGRSYITPLEGGICPAHVNTLDTPARGVNVPAVFLLVQFGWCDTAQVGFSHLSWDPAVLCMRKNILIPKTNF